MDLDKFSTLPVRYLKMIADTESNKSEQGGIRPGEIFIFAALTPRQYKSMYGLPRRIDISLEQPDLQEQIREDLMKLCVEPQEIKKSTEGDRTATRPVSQNYLNLRKSRW